MILDVRSKVILLLFANYLLLKRVFNIYEWILIIYVFILFLLAKKIKKAIIYFFIFVTLFVIDVWIVDYTSNQIASFLSMVAVGGRLMFSCFFVGSYLISTTSTSMMINGLRKWKISENILLVLAIMIRFFPTVKKDYIDIKQSLQLRGLFLRWYDVILRPIQFYEFVSVPLLMRASKNANELTIATVTKGINSTNKPISYFESKFKFLDYFTVVLIVCCVVAIQFGVKL